MADKLDMKSMNITQENIAKIKALFPSAVTEVMGDDGKVKLAIDFECLKQELSDDLVSDKAERYQMTWPDKSKAKVLANSRITATLRPDVEKSVDFDTTENLYIEGDNLDVLKLLRETYLGKVKMIYIDPPYNTGNDFVYEDDFAMSTEDYAEVSGQYDDQGNRLFANTESNGRFHTDWLNMIYPRLKIARDLLSDDGVIFISIDDNEVGNLKKICDEIFGEQNFATQFIWTKTATPPSLSHKCRKTVEYVLCYEKNLDNTRYFGSLLSGGDVPLLNSGNPIKELVFPKGSVRFNFINEGTVKGGTYEKVDLFDDIAVSNSTNQNEFRMRAEFKWGQPMLYQEVSNGTYFIIKTDKLSIRFQRPYDDSNYKTPNNFLNLELSKELGIGTNESAVKELESIGMSKYFSFPKPISLIKYLINMIAKFDKDAIVLDFFSGSATTAHAVMQLNSEDGGNRKFIVVQLPEKCDEKSEAYKAGYKTICDIGEERIRRAGKKIQSEVLSVKSGVEGQMSIDNSTPQTPHSKLDIGFRVLKLDSSNMQEVYYNPSAMTQDILAMTVDNVKADRTPLDLLFQVMLDLGVELSAKIEEHIVNGKKYYTVNGNDIIACFDDDIDNDVITAIANQNPLYAVFKDKSFATDSVGINNEQLFKTYSPSTVVKVI